MWLIDLDHASTRRPEKPSQTCSVRSGRLHTDRLEPAELPQPAQQLPIACECGSELAVAEPAAMLVECYRVMGIKMAIHAANHGRLIVSHTGLVVSLR